MNEADPMPKETSACIHEAFNARLAADYEIEELLSVDEAQAHSENARRFLDHARGALTGLSSNDSADLERT